MIDVVVYIFFFFILGLRESKIINWIFFLEKNNFVYGWCVDCMDVYFFFKIEKLF